MTVVTGWLPVWLAGAGLHVGYDGAHPADWVSALGEALREQWDEMAATYYGPADGADASAALGELAAAVASSLPPSLRDAARTRSRAALDAIEAAHFAWALYAVEALHAGGTLAGWRAELTITRDRAAAVLQRGARTA